MIKMYNKYKQLLGNITYVRQYDALWKRMA